MFSNVEGYGSRHTLLCQFERLAFLVFEGGFPPIAFIGTPQTAHSQPPSGTWKIHNAGQHLTEQQANFDHHQLY
jgi:hypothetical protein